MIEHRHLAHSYFVSHLFIRLILHISQTEDKLSDWRFKVVDEKQQLFKTLVRIFR